MVKKILKEIIIILLLLVAIVLLIGVLFYDYIPTGKVVPEIEKYQTAESVQKEINETVSANDSEIIVTYEIDNTDLSTFEKTKDYDKGKENPFAAYSAETDENSTNTNTVGGNGTNGSSTTNNSANTNNSDGTFFNSTKTK